MKPTPTFQFADEQFSVKESRQWAANWLWSCRRSKGNLGSKRFTVRRLGPGKYSVQLNFTGSPVAILTTK